MRAIPVVLLGLTLTGCNVEEVKGFLKQIESGAYDAAAKGASEFCDKMDNDLGRVERIQVRREIRQRGYGGPLVQEGSIESPVGFSLPEAVTTPAPGVYELDVRTLYGSGPVVRIWCEGEEVPVAVWRDLAK